jgi:integral membrane protein (TIGR01906 family)
LRILTAVAKWLFVLCLPFLLVTASIWWAANSHWLYTSGFTRYDVSQTTGLVRSELDKAAAGLIDYFNSPEEYVDITVVRDGQSFDLFTEEEAVHFRDVKQLFRLDFYVLLGTAIYCVAYASGNILLRQRRHYRRLAQAILGGSVLTLALMLLLGAGALLDFDQLFLRFHLFAFTNEFWSAEGYMLLLFPGGFWYDAVIYCGAATAIATLILAAVAGGYLRATRDHQSDETQVRESQQ